MKSTMRYSPMVWFVSKALLMGEAVRNSELGAMNDGLKTSCVSARRPWPTLPRLLRSHQLLAEADRDGEGDGCLAFAEARVEDADDASVLVEDGAAGVAGARRVDLQLVRVADETDGLLLDAVVAVVVVLAAIDAPDVAVRDGRVGYLDRGRVEGLERVLRVDDAVNGLRDRGVAEDGHGVAGLDGVVVVIDLDRRDGAGAVNLDERHVVARRDRRELRRQPPLGVREEHVEVVVPAVIGHVVLLAVRRNPGARRFGDGADDGRLAVRPLADDDAVVGRGRELVVRLPRGGDVRVRQDEAVARHREAGAGVTTADADVERVRVVGQVRLDGAVGDADVAGARLAVDHHVLVIDEAVALLRDETPRHVNLDDRAAVLLDDLAGLHRGGGRLGGLRVVEVLLDRLNLVVGLLGDVLLRRGDVAVAEEPADGEDAGEEDDDDGDDGEVGSALALFSLLDVGGDDALDRGLADAARRGRPAGRRLPGRREGRRRRTGSARGADACGRRPADGRGHRAGRRDARRLGRAGGARLDIEDKFRAGGAELHHVAGVGADRARNPLAVHKRAVAAVQVCDDELRGVIRVLRDPRVLATDEVVAVGVVLDR